MKTLRSILAILLIAAWSHLSWAVDLAPGQGVSFSQIGYADDPANTFTPIGLVKVDMNQLRVSTGIPSGYLNVVTARGWVVRNVLILDESIYPYSGINSEFDLGVAAATAVTQLPATARYTADSLSSFTDAPAGSFPVTPLSLFFGGAGLGAGGPVTPPNFTDVQFANPADVRTVMQYDHPNLEAANNQCVPMSMANSLQFLKDTKGLSLPHEHKAGLKGDNSLVGQLDSAGNRSLTSRQSGSGLPGMLNTKLSYIAANNLQNRIVTTHWGAVGPDAGSANASVTVNGVTATSTGKGNAVDFDAMLQALDEGQDCEMAYTWPATATTVGGGHAVDIVGAGRYKGQPWLLHTSDMIQANANNANADTQGAGPNGMRFEYLGPPTGGQYKFRNGSTIVEVICEKYVPPPATETVTRTNDPAGHSCCVDQPPTWANILFNGSAMTMTGSASWLPMTGTIQSNGAFSLNSTATVAGFSNVTNTFNGTMTGANFAGTITVGAGGQLPTGAPISWDVTIVPPTMAASPAMRVNGFRHGYRAMDATEILRPTISMQARSQAGQNVDWWLYAVAGGTTFHFDLATMNWALGMAPTFTGPMGNIPIFPLPYLRLPTGSYDISFGYDTVPDGAMTTPSAVIETVRITVP